MLRREKKEAALRYMSPDMKKLQPLLPEDQPHRLASKKTDSISIADAKKDPKLALLEGSLVTYFKGQLNNDLFRTRDHVKGLTHSI